MESDASIFAVVAILLQLHNNGLWHPVAYWLCKLNRFEMWYDTHDKELLAIIAAFKNWRHYLEGSQYPVQVWSDHANLQYFMMTKLLNQHQTRWVEALSAYNFVLSHCPRKMNPADAPSHWADYTQEFHGETLLPTLQQKIHHGVQEGWQQINTNFTQYIELVWVHDTTHIKQPT